MTAEPLGPALAAELGGVWDAPFVYLEHGDVVECKTNGAVWIETCGCPDGCPIRLGSFSDGAAALARRARRLGVA